MPPITQTVSEANETNQFNKLLQSFRAWAAFTIVLGIMEQISHLFFLLLVLPLISDDADGGVGRGRPRNSNGSM